MHRMNPHPEITTDHGLTEEGPSGRSGFGPGPQGDGRATLLLRYRPFPTGLLPLRHIDRLNRCTQTNAQVFIRRDHPLLLKLNQRWLKLLRGRGTEELHRVRFEWTDRNIQEPDKREPAEQNSDSTVRIRATVSILWTLLRAGVADHLLMSAHQYARLHHQRNQ